MTLVLALVACGSFTLEPPASAPRLGEASGDPVQTAMATQPLAYTRHARCRMDCRNVDEEEILAILTTGERDPARGREEPGRCPTHALEGRSRDGQRLRVVFAACEDETRVVTAIDLDFEGACACE